MKTNYLTLLDQFALLFNLAIVVYSSKYIIYAVYE